MLYLYTFAQRHQECWWYQHAVQRQSVQGRLQCRVPALGTIFQWKCAPVTIRLQASRKNWKSSVLFIWMLARQQWYEHAYEQIYGQLGMHLHMCVYMCAYIYMCIYVYICVCIYVYHIYMICIIFIFLLLYFIIHVLFGLINFALVWLPPCPWTFLEGALIFAIIIIIIIIIF